MTRSSQRHDRTLGYPSIALANIKYEQNSSWDQFQLFGELEVRRSATCRSRPA
jgi:iron complex outermembrane receptor protein